MSDPSLIERHLQGDRIALNEILDAHEASLLRYARVLLGSADRAEDAVQETFLRFLREGPKMRDVQALFPWLLQVTRRVCWDMQRKERRMDRKHEEARRQAAGAAVEAAEQPMLAGEVRERVRGAVARLPEVQQEVVRLRQWDGLSYQETADCLGLTISNVSHHLGQALKAVAGCRRIASSAVGWGAIRPQVGTPRSTRTCRKTRSSGSPTRRCRPSRSTSTRLPMPMCAGSFTPDGCPRRTRFASKR